MRTGSRSPEAGAPSPLVGHARTVIPRSGRTRWRPPAPRGAAVAAAGLLLAACGAQDSRPGTTVPDPGAATGTGPAGYVQPPLVALGPGAPDLPGDDTVDWRRQVRESVERHPGLFALPQALPDDVDLAFTSTWTGHPVLDVASAGSGVIVCVDELAACTAALGAAPVVLVARGTVDSGEFWVLRKPAAQPGTTGELTPEQERYWTTVPFTTAVPDWAGGDAGTAPPVVPPADGPTPPSSVEAVGTRAGEVLRVADATGEVGMTVGVPYEDGGGWRLDVTLTDVPAGYAFSPARLSVDDYRDTWVYPTAALLDGAPATADPLPLRGDAVVTVLLSGAPPAEGVVSYHGGDGFAPEWRYALPG